jgi:hypothetical protein
VSKDDTRLFLSGGAAAVARARAAVEAVVVPLAKIDVLAHWGGLVEDGVHASKEDLMKVLYGAGATRQKSGRACERSAHLAIC